MTQAPQPPANPQPQAPPPQAPAPQPGLSGKPDLTMAWLPHLLMLLTWWLGPLILWLVKKDENKLVAFHGKQTFIFGFVPMGVLILWFIFMWIPFVGCCLGVVLGLGYMGWVAYGIVGTVFAAQGKPFKYFFVADKFCAAEFAAAYPGAPSGQQTP